VNAEQVPKTTNAEADPILISGKVATVGVLALAIRARGGLEARLIAIVENCVHFNSCGIEPRIGFRTNLHTKSARERERHERIISLHWRSCSTLLRHSLVGSNVRVASLSMPLLRPNRALAHDTDWR
jgi:hypothetical protein